MHMPRDDRQQASTDFALWTGACDNPLISGHDVSRARANEDRA